MSQNEGISSVSLSIYNEAPHNVFLSPALHGAQNLFQYKQALGSIEIVIFLH